MTHSKLTQVLNHPRYLLGLVLLVGLVHGLAYVFLVPPWQHYDEPTQFEFAWLIANRSQIPETREYDQRLRREVAASMVEHDFFESPASNPNLVDQDDPIWIGISQITEKPLYYILVSLPLRLIRSSDVTLQLHAGRLVSLFLLLVTIVCGYGIVREIAPPGHPLRWMVPLSLALLPGFVDIMTSLNDDVGAVAFFSLYLWAGARMIVRGVNWQRLFALVILTAACFWVKNTVTVAVLFFFMILLFSAIRIWNRRAAWGTFVLGTVFLMPVVFHWNDAAYWYPNTSFEQTLRGFSQDAPIGDNVFEFNLSPQEEGPSLVQVLPESINEDLRGERVTLGAWIWASQPVKVQSPLLVTDSGSQYAEVEVGLEPKFFTVTAKIPKKNSMLNVVLSPNVRENADDKVINDLTIYVDGVLLVEGNHSLSSLPVFDRPNGAGGRWGDRDFVNLLRNGSAETTWPAINNWLDEVLTANFPGHPSLYMAFLLDPRPAISYYRMTAERLAESFWAGFGWGHVPLRGVWPYRILKLIGLVGVLGAGVVLVRDRKHLPWALLLFLGTGLIVIWGTAFLRGTNTILDGTYFIPVARYAYPAIIPTILVLSAGWMGIFHVLEKSTRIPQSLIYVLFGVFFIALDVLGLVTILNYYG